MTGGSVGGGSVTGGSVGGGSVTGGSVTTGAWPTLPTWAPAGATTNNPTTTEQQRAALQFSRVGLFADMLLHAGDRSMAAVWR